MEGEEGAEGRGMERKGGGTPRLSSLQELLRAPMDTVSLRQLSFLFLLLQFYCSCVPIFHGNVKHMPMSAPHLRDKYMELSKERKV